MDRKGSSKYPWEKWSGELADGSCWKVTRFLDYHCESASFASQVYQEAARRDMKVAVATFPNFVLFKFYPSTSYWKPNMLAIPAVKKLVKKYR